MSVPQFVELDGAKLLAENIAAYEAIVGRTLYPGQVETLLINTFTEIQLRTLQQVQNACAQMLVAYAIAPALDELGKLFSVTRLPASGALVTIRFSLVTGHTGVTIPAGTRVQGNDGKVTFSTRAAVTINAGTNTADVSCIAETQGAAGNGYQVNTIQQILDPLPFVSSATNTTVSSGGADVESDDELRERLYLAPAQFSVAGPRDAYAFFARKASPAIIDVSVEQTTPGTVGVYPLVEGGTTGTDVLNLVEAILNADDVRPATDTVVVQSPTVVSYNITATIVVFTTADQPSVLAEITAKLLEYTTAKARKLGQDVTRAQLFGVIASVPGVYNVTLTAPAADVAVGVSEVAILGTQSISITGTNVG